MTVFFGAMTSILLGTSDYFGRFVTKRAAAATAVATVMAVGTVVGLALVTVVPSAFTGRDFGLGAGSGVVNGAALALLYAGMARSSTAVVSPIVALGMVLVPTVFDLSTGGSLATLQIAGFVVALLGLLLTTFSPELGDRVRTGLMYGSVGGLAAGVALLMIGRTDIDSGLWAAVGQRLTGAIFLLGVATATSLPRVLPSGLRVPGILAGVIAVGGIACFIAGSQRGSLSVVVVTGSMFPAVTAVLAWWFDDDALRWWQVVGIGLVLGGVGLIAAG